MIAKRISIALFCYSLFFRLYAVGSLCYSFFIQTPNESLIKSTNDGYQLTIFQLEFYFFLIILYSFRPSRFNKTISKSYTTDGPKNFSKKTFFWIVYVGVLLAVFGIPLLIFKNSISDILTGITNTNQYILENKALLTMASFFLILNVLGLYYDLVNAVDNAKVQFFRILFTMMLIIPIALVIYIISIFLHLKVDILIIICMAFNLAFLYFSIQSLWKNKESMKQSADQKSNSLIK